MKLKLGVVMDPIAKINYKKDSTLAILLEAQKRDYAIYYMELNDLFLLDGKAFAKTKHLNVHVDESHWFDYGKEETIDLSQLDIVLMRKDPPFDMEYVFSTYVLEIAEAQGVLVVNKPQSLRDANEKLFISWFPQCCPKTLVSRDLNLIRDFLNQEKEIILKPLGGMGGASVFHIQKDDRNANVIIESLTDYGKHFVMAQKYIPDVLEKGDKRVLLIDGKPIPYGLARIPAKGDFRGNLASGAQGKAVELTKRDYWICEQVAPVLKEKGLVFVGLDIIGDYLTEINVTSPTCIREIEHEFKINISAELLDCVEKKRK